MDAPRKAFVLHLDFLGLRDEPSVELDWTPSLLVTNGGGQIAIADYSVGCVGLF